MVPTLAVLTGVLILMQLGFWQVRRYNEKEALLALAEARIAMPPVSLAEAMAKPEAHAWRRVVAKGVYIPDETVLLLDRHTGETGSRVLTPLQADGLPPLAGQPQAILVDRGWVAYDVEERFLEEEHLKNKPVELTGSLVLLKDEPAREGPVEKHRHQLAFNFSNLRAQIPHPLVPALLKRGDLDDDDTPEGAWAVPRMHVNHREYAWTWFLLAATLLVMYVGANLKRG
jgi:surfeit locus 1 family protein